MGKVKDNLTAQCTECELLYPKRRAELGYDTCLTCGEAHAREVKHASVPMHKSNYVYMSPANRDDLKGINNKGGFFR
jgi:ribosomal protein L37AE/L43A